MFTHHCTACDRRQLIFFSQVARALPLGTDGGLEVTFACWCGAEQTGALTDATASATTAVERDLLAA